MRSAARHNDEIAFLDFKGFAIDDTRTAPLGRVGVDESKLILLPARRRSRNENHERPGNNYESWRHSEREFTADAFRDRSIFSSDAIPKRIPPGRGPKFPREKKGSGCRRLPSLDQYGPYTRNGSER